MQLLIHAHSHLPTEKKPRKKTKFNKQSIIETMRKQKLQTPHTESSNKTTITSEDECQGIITASPEKTKEFADAGMKQTSLCIEWWDTDLAWTEEKMHLP